jgi:hypothetical protein
MVPSNDYEAKVVQGIIAWKREKTSIFGHVSNHVTTPVASVMSYFVPKGVVAKGIESAYALSGWRVGPEPVLKLAKVESLEELREKPLEFCDSLAGQYDLGSQAVAAMDGAVTGAGGFLLAGVDVVALTTIVLRAIRFTGYCYGYALDRPEDQPYVLGILMVACTRSPTERVELLGKLSNIEKYLMKGTVEAVLIEGLSKQFVKLVSLESIPGIGAVFGSAANLVFCRHVTRCASRIFQERWLGDRGRFPEVEAAAAGNP